jgi:hypothetical protein
MRRVGDSIIPQTLLAQGYFIIFPLLMSVKNTLNAGENDKSHPPVGGGLCGSGDSGAIRTLDLQLRRLLLYPTELRNLFVSGEISDYRITEN